MIRIIVKDQDYIDCCAASGNMWCSSKSGEYGYGLLNSPLDRHRTERLGRIGEKALSLYLNKEVDFEYKVGGDNGDLKSEKIVDIKTASRNYGKLLIQAKSEFGYCITLKSDYYVGAYCVSECAKNKLAEIELVGWINKRKVITKPIVPAMRGTHKNYEVKYSELEPIETLKVLF
jgi:hypothetical protein